MQVVINILTVVYIIVSLVLIVIVLMQPGKSDGLSGSIAGGADTFFSKNKSRTIDAALAKWTGVVAGLFIVLSLVLVILISKNAGL
jgi:preprotein translocase subunit SecG